MKVAITGACGYLGSIVTEKLSQDYPDVEVLALDIREPVKRVPKVIYEVIDIRTSSIQDVLQKHKVQTVVHLAAIIPGGKSNPQLEYEVDVLGTKNTLEACIAAKVEKIIVSSSGAAYGYHPDNPEWITETEPIRGNDVFPYSRHKRLVEEMLLEYRQKHPELQQVIFRIGTILGKNVNNQLAALFERKKVIAIKGSDSRFVFIWDEDVCACVVRAITTNVVGIYNVAGDGALSIYEIAAILHKKVVVLSASFLKVALFVLKKLGLSPYGPEQIIFLRYRPVLDNSKLKKDFGYTPQKTSKEVFFHYIEEKGII